MAAQQLDLRVVAHDVHQGNSVLGADAIEHPAQVGGGGGVHQRRVPFAAQGLDHAERGERIDEGRGAVGRRCTRRQHQALLERHAAILRVHGAAQRGDGSCRAGLARPGRSRLRRRRPRPRCPPAWTGRSGRPCLCNAPPPECGRAIRGSSGVPRRLGLAHVGTGEQQAEIGGIDGRRLDADHHFVGRRDGGGHAGQRQFEVAVAGDQRAKLQSGA